MVHSRSTENAKYAMRIAGETLMAAIAKDEENIAKAEAEQEEKVKEFIRDMHRRRTDGSR
jgi:hypothetical protein